MSIKLTYTTEDGTTFYNINQAKIHDAITQTGVYVDKYKINELVKELDKILVVEYRADLEKAKEDMDMYKRAGKAKTPVDIAINLCEETKTPVESIITKDVYEGLGSPSVRG